MYEDRSLTRLTSQLLNKPLACTAEHAALIIAAVRSELNVNLLTTADGMQLDTVAMDALAARGRAAADARRVERDGQDDMPEIQNGVAIIPITGTLTKTWGLEPYSGMTGYDGIKRRLLAAVNAPDSQVSDILLDIDSPGGAVAGMLDLSDIIYAVNAKNGGKRITAIANEQMCSAAFALGCSADEIYLPRTGEVGSVGILAIHTDVSMAMAKAGINVTIFRAGKYKAEGHPMEEMTDDAKKRFQETMDDFREMFADVVARGRGMTKKAVLDTEALTYIGDRARGIGFATAVASDDQVWANMMKRLGRT